MRHYGGGQVGPCKRDASGGLCTDRDSTRVSPSRRRLLGETELFKASGVNKGGFHPDRGEIYKALEYQGEFLEQETVSDLFTYYSERVQ